MTTFEETVKCPDCGSRSVELDDNRGELICKDCGLVIEDNIIDPGPDWRNYQGQEDASRVGAPDNPLIHDKGRGSDFNWREATGKQKSQFYRMDRWQRNSRMGSSKDRSLATAFQMLKRIGHQMGAGQNVINATADIYRAAVDADLIKGRSIDSILAASLYGGCREVGHPRTLAEISRWSRVGQKEVGSTWRLLAKSLKIRTRPPEPENFLGRFCSELGLKPETEAAARELIDKLKSKDFSNGRSPVVVCAGAIYVAAALSKQRRTQREISEITDVTEVSIRNCYKALTDILEIDFD